MTEREKALVGLEFIRGDRELKKQRDRAEKLCFEYNNTSPDNTEKKEENTTRPASGNGASKVEGADDVANDIFH